MSGSTLSPVSEAIIQPVKCRCAKERCSTDRRQCCKAGLLFTDLCSCSDDDDNDDDDDDDDDDDEWKNQQDEYDDNDSDIEEEEDDDT